MANGIETMLCFDLGLTGAELHGASAWMIDEVVRPEFERALGVSTQEEWCVKTLDSALKVCTVRSGLSKMEAAALVSQLSPKGELQHWVERI